jgi:hypothetical protein
MALTPEQEARYALNWNSSRSGLSPAGQLAYDRLVAEGYGKTSPDITRGRQAIEARIAILENGASSPATDAELAILRADLGKLAGGQFSSLSPVTIAVMNAGKPSAERRLSPAEIDRTRELYEKTARALEEMEARVAALDPEDGLYSRLVQERDKLREAKERLAQVLISGHGSPPSLAQGGIAAGQGVPQTVVVHRRNGVWTFVGVLIAFILILFIIGLFVKAHEDSQLQPGQPAPCPTLMVWNPQTQECQY